MNIAALSISLSQAKLLQTISIAVTGQAIMFHQEAFLETYEVVHTTPTIRSKY